MTSRPLGLVESAQVVGRMRFVELAAFERLGRRARRATSAGVATWLSGAALAHAYRATLLEDHLPVSAGLPGAAELTTSPGDDVDAVLDLLGPGPGTPGASVPPEAAGATGAPAGDDAELLTALTGVLYPAMLASYEARLALASPACDPPLRRTLGRLVFDLGAVLEAGRGLLGAHPGVPEGASRPSRGTADRVAACLARSGPFGPIGHEY